MTTLQDLVLPMMALFSLAFGIVLQLRSRRDENPLDPLVSTWNWRKWKPAWRMRPHFKTDHAYRQFVAGGACIATGGMLLLVQMWIR
ncbi:MAG: hypothetical protein GF346_12455 [Candidatus Eisenbacteria bacterium]|nr:hypothetical protein [Candidatus Latescibacterota bacterium]MBD3303248.1 hypothetical protein [Candidatus Eisenbacteria bacterium]